MKDNEPTDDDIISSLLQSTDERIKDEQRTQQVAFRIYVELIAERFKGPYEQAPDAADATMRWCCLEALQAAEVFVGHCDYRMIKLADKIKAERNAQEASNS